MTGSLLHAGCVRIVHLSRSVMLAGGVAKLRHDDDGGGIETEHRDTPSARHKATMSESPQRVETRGGCWLLLVVVAGLTRERSAGLKICGQTRDDRASCSELSG